MILYEQYKTTTHSSKKEVLQSEGQAVKSISIFSLIYGATN